MPLAFSPLEKVYWVKSSCVSWFWITSPTLLLNDFKPSKCLVKHAVLVESFDSRRPFRKLCQSCHQKTFSVATTRNWRWRVIWMRIRGYWRMPRVCVLPLLTAIWMLTAKTNRFLCTNERRVGPWKFSSWQKSLRSRKRRVVVSTILFHRQWQT